VRLSVQFVFIFVLIINWF